MRAFGFPTLLAAAMASALFASPAGATIYTCQAPDDGLTYSDVCPSAATSGRCIANGNVFTGGSVLNGCCNKGTCNGSQCVTGDLQDAYCLNDGNSCTEDKCTSNTQQQASCQHPPEDAGTECNLDNNVCTLDTCNGSSTCVAGPLDTCAAEQANNPAGEPICKPWKCHPTNGCDETAVPNDPVVACDDGKDCTTGDRCVNGNCVDNGTLAPPGTPCRDDDTTLGNGDNRTWCQAGTCIANQEACSNPQNLAHGAPCDPNPCTNSFCNGSGANGTCVISSCNTGQTVDCEPCGITFECLNYGAGQNANIKNPCGCLTNF